MSKFQPILDITHLRLSGGFLSYIVESSVTGQVTLFVIDHWETEADRVEKFEFDRTRRVLRHKQSIKSDAFT